MSCCLVNISDSDVRKGHLFYYSNLLQLPLFDKVVCELLGATEELVVLSTHPFALSPSLSRVISSRRRKVCLGGKKMFLFVDAVNFRLFLLEKIRIVV